MNISYMTAPAVTTLPIYLRTRRTSKLKGLSYFHFHPFFLSPSDLTLYQPTLCIVPLRRLVRVYCLVAFLVLGTGIDSLGPDHCLVYEPQSNKMRCKEFSMHTVRWNRGDKPDWNRIFKSDTCCKALMKYVPGKDTQWLV